MKTMRRSSYKQILLLCGTLFLLLTLPAVCIHSLRIAFFNTISNLICLAKGPLKEDRIAYLEAENHQLRLKLNALRPFVEQGEDLNVKIAAARVIYRDPQSWSSSLWIDVGSKTSPVIQKNSPVIVGRVLVGVIDYVGKKQSRVRLITDVGIKPAVRALRGKPQDLLLINQITALLHQLNSRDALPINQSEKATLKQLLIQLKDQLPLKTRSFYLAKGIVQGGGAPLWRSINQTLRGVGFNYDFSDNKGPARALETGKPLFGETPSLPLIQENDLLVTTGLDGVFPPGLLVAQVTKVYPLKEGAYTYDLEAFPILKSLEGIQTLFVISPIGYDKEDQPTLYSQLEIGGP